MAGYAVRAFGGAFLYNDTNSYFVLIDSQPVFVLAGTLQVQNTIGRRGTAQFSVLTQNTDTHYQQYQRVEIYDSKTNLVFSGYISQPKEQKPGFQSVLVTQIQCVDQHFLADKRVVATTYTNKTCGFMAQDLLNTILSQEGVTAGQVYDGLVPDTTLDPSPGLYPGGNVGTIPSANFVYCSVAQALDELVKAASVSGVPYYWMIDQNKKLYFVPYTAIVNSTVVDGTQIDQLGTAPYVQRQNPTYRNTQYILGGTAQTVTQTETRKGDGNTTAFTMGFAFSQVPTVTVNSVAKTVGIKGVDTGKDWYWSQGDPTLTQDSSGVKLTATDTLQVVYIGQYDSIVIAANDAQINYQASLDGTTGIVEEVEKDEQLTSVTSALDEASQFLTRYGTQGAQFQFTTLQTGFAPGQSVVVNIPDFGFNSAQMLIESVIASDQADSYNIWYTVQAVIGPFDVTWESFMAKLLAQPHKAASINAGVTQSTTLLANFTGGFTMSASAAISVYACPVVNTTLFPNTTLYPC